jgi:hypothetical protein
MAGERKARNRIAVVGSPLSVVPDRLAPTVPAERVLPEPLHVFTEPIAVEPLDHPQRSGA